MCKWDLCSALEDGPNQGDAMISTLMCGGQVPSILPSSLVYKASALVWTLQSDVKTILGLNCWICEFIIKLIGWENGDYLVDMGGQW